MLNITFLFLPRVPLINLYWLFIYLFLSLIGCFRLNADITAMDNLATEPYFAPSFLRPTETTLTVLESARRVAALLVLSLQD